MLRVGSRASSRWRRPSSCITTASWASSLAKPCIESCVLYSWRRSAPAVASSTPAAIAGTVPAGASLLTRASGPELGQLAEVLERCGVGERIEVLHRQSVDDIAHGELGELAGEGAREIRNRNDLGRHVARGGMGAHGLADLLLQLLIELRAVAHAHEQHDAHIPVPVLADRQRLGDLRQTLDRGIDLRGTDAYAAGIQHRIRAAVDDETIMRRDYGVVAMMPNPGKALEVRGTVLRTLRVVPEAEWHGRKGCRAHELAARSKQRLPGIVEHVHRHTEATAL